MTTDYRKPEPLWLKALAVVAVIAAIVVLVWPMTGWAAPRVPNQQACQYLADYALVARALAQDSSISELQADTVLDRIYVLRDPMIDEVQRLLREHARTETLRNAQRYSGEFLQACVERRGVIDSFFGT